MSRAVSRRDHLIDTAIRLFNRDGFHATGIDAILAEAGVAKMTLYNHFKSKDDLIVAALEVRDERWMAWFRGDLNRRARTPERRLLLIFELLGEWFGQPDFRGCMFINAASEYCGLDPRIAEVSARHKQLVKQEIRFLPLNFCARCGEVSGL